jgi:hypothetical protein
MSGRRIQRACGWLAPAAAALWASFELLSSPALAATPIAGGHYLLDTPQSHAALFPGAWPDEGQFGGG